MQRMQIQYLAPEKREEEEEGKKEKGGGEGGNATAIERCDCSMVPKIVTSIKVSAMESPHY